MKKLETYLDPLVLKLCFCKLTYIDTVAMTILALRCIVKDHRHRNLQHSLRRPSIGLARQQQSDGGFGNLYNTALVIQVLQFSTTNASVFQF